MIGGFEGKTPQIHESAFVHPEATLIGDVRIGPDSNIWPGVVIRGDFAKVEIGNGTCVQDNAIINPAGMYQEEEATYAPAIIGSNLIIGHRSVVHGATVHDGCAVGSGSIVSSDSEVGENSLVGMGAVLLKSTKVPPKTIVVGIPSRTLRELSDEEIGQISRQVKNYVELGRRYKKELNEKI